MQYLKQQVDLILVGSHFALFGSVLQVLHSGKKTYTLTLFLSPLQEVGSIIGKVSQISLCLFTALRLHCLAGNVKACCSLHHAFWFVTERRVCQEDERRGRPT